jgi:hypothetical protein
MIVLPRRALAAAKAIPAVERAWEVTLSDEIHVEQLRAEALVIREAALIGAERHYAAETPWYYSIYWLGLPSAVLSAIAGAAALSQYPQSSYVAGGISIIVAILSSLMTFLDPSKRANAHHTAAKGYERLYHEAGFFYRIEALDGADDIKQRKVRLTELAKKRNDLDEASPAIPGRAYEVAEKHIKEDDGEVVRDPDDTEVPNAQAK